MYATIHHLNASSLCQFNVKSCVCILTVTPSGFVINLVYHKTLIPPKPINYIPALRNDRPYSYWRFSVLSNWVSITTSSSSWVIPYQVWLLSGWKTSTISQAASNYGQKGRLLHDLSVGKSSIYMWMVKLWHKDIYSMHFPRLVWKPLELQPT